MLYDSMILCVTLYSRNDQRLLKAVIHQTAQADVSYYLITKLVIGIVELSMLTAAGLWKLVISGDVSV